MSDWLVELLKTCVTRSVAFWGGGSSVKTAEYEIHAPTTAEVVAIMAALRDQPPIRPLRQSQKNDSLFRTVQAEEPMTVKG